VATQLERVLKEQLAGVSRVDRISARAKSPIRFLAKAEKLHEGARKYSDPMSQIQDQIGARVVVFYEDDVSEMSTLVERYYHAHERQVLVPESEWEFGYFGLHYVLALPADAVPRDLAIDDAPDVFELQIKTLWQHAWSEANHDLGYKPPEELTVDARRRLALTSAQAWGADRTFAELFRELAPAE
jgi:ppGpp synthetase/RelA/SpoT-type nucleotidyltranferase